MNYPLFLFLYPPHKLCGANRSSQIALSDKIAYCEEVYEKWNTPAIFKNNPLMDSSFDQKLMERGYHIAHTTEVMTMSLESYEPKEPLAEVSLTPHYYL